MSVRLTAFELLFGWQKNRSYINKQLSAFGGQKKLDRQEMALCSNICLGVVERKPELDYIISKLSNTEIKKIKPKILIILEMGLYQLRYTDLKPYAVCNEMTGLTKKIGLHGLSGYVNAVLRGYLRKKDELVFPDEEEDPVGFLSVTYSVPKWLTEHFIRETGIENTKKIFAYFIEDRTVSVRRVKSLISDRELSDEFKNRKIEYRTSPYLDYVFDIYNMPDLIGTDLLSKAFLQVQNLSSVLVGEVAKKRLGLKVLDLCSAPGGKTLHLADIMTMEQRNGGLESNWEISARDIHEFSLNLLKNRAEVSGFDKIKTEVKDACFFYEEDESVYDLIIADLPCSGLGVISRKPDIKYYSSADGIKNLAKLQFNILKNAVRYLKKGGSLIYSTCTVSQAENFDISDRIANELGLCRLDISDSLPEKMRKALKENWRIQILPGEYGSDGFFISGFYKK